MRKPLTYSYSAFSQFDTCPKQFYHLRVAKDVVEVEGDASLAGKRDHKSLEDRLKDGTPLPKHLEKHESKCAAILSGSGTVLPEDELSLTRELIPTGWWDADAWLRAKIDVHIKKDTASVVLDWKTGKRYPKYLQLEIDALNIFLHHPQVEKVSGAFLWLRDDAIDKKTYFRDTDLDRILKDVMARVSRIEEAAEDGVWQAKPGPMCKFCAAKDICSYADTRGRRW